MRIIPELEEAAARHIAGRAGTIGAVRVDVRHERHLHFTALAKGGGAEFVLSIDEPPERGGANEGAAPLQFFLAGAASCLLTQYAKLAIARHLDLTDLRAAIRGHIRHEVNGRFLDLVIEVSIAGTASAEAVKSLAQDAEQYCYVFNTLRAVVPWTTRVRYNDADLTVIMSIPNAASSRGAQP
ncbi:MAG: hypothetical protein A2V59_05200 [Armatimonadetes bacterium RBG_19FT_COMBO_69_19]|jgi:uncharacterized OsmC-like protein|nr:MAG: hypothetical protein A2V59_05200 [Armatimonadetes bacterium RBG_19FT_COMBO_69_19]